MTDFSNPDPVALTAIVVVATLPTFSLPLFILLPIIHVFLIADKRA